MTNDKVPPSSTVEERWLDIALEEEFGGAAPPDLRDAVVSTRPEAGAAARRAAIASVGAPMPAVRAPVLTMVLGAAAVLFALLWPLREALAPDPVPVAPSPAGVGAGQDPARFPIRTSKPVIAKDVEEFRALIGTATALRVEALSIDIKGNGVEFRPTASRTIRDAALLKRWVQGLGGCTQPTASTNLLRDCCRLTFLLPGDRSLRCLVVSEHPRVRLPLAGVEGENFHELTPEVRSLLAGEVRRLHRDVAPGLDPVDLEQLRKLGPEHTALYCKGIDDANVAELTRFVGLRSLTLAECGQLSAAGLSALGRLVKLRQLTVVRPSAAVVAGIAEHAPSWPSLRSLRLLESRAVDGDALAGLSRTKIETLDLSGCRRVDAKALVSLEGLPSLRSLALRDVGCSTREIDALIEMRQLTSIDLRRCLLHAEAIARLRAALPGCAVQAPSSTAGSDTWRNYVVRAGDSYYTISKTVYGSHRHAAKIMEANDVSDPRRIRVGTELKIPPLR